MRAETLAQDAKAQETRGVELVLRSPGCGAQPVGEAGSGDAPGWGWTLGFWERAGRPGARVQKVPGGGYFPWPALGRRGGGAGRRSPSPTGRGARISGVRAKTSEGAPAELLFPSEPRFPCSPRPPHSPSLLTSRHPLGPVAPSPAGFPDLPPHSHCTQGSGEGTSLEPVPPHPLLLFSLLPHTNLSFLPSLFLHPWDCL